MSSAPHEPGANLGAPGRAIRALQARPLLYGTVVGTIAGVVLTTVVGLSAGGAWGSGVDEAFVAEYERLEGENAALRDEIGALQQDGGAGAAPAEASSSTPSAGSEATEPGGDGADAGAPPVYRVSSAPVTLKDGECLDPDSQAEDWDRPTGGGEATLCFRNSGTGERSLIYAKDVVIVERLGNVESPDYGACKADRETTAFVEVEADSMNSRDYGICFATGSDRTTFVHVIMPILDRYDSSVEAVEVLLTVWDDAE